MIALQDPIDSQPPAHGAPNVQYGALSPFRSLLPPKDWAKIETLPTSTATQWYESKKHLPQLEEFLNGLRLENMDRPWKGFTNDGQVVEDVHIYNDDEGAPIEKMNAAASRLLSVMSEAEYTRSVFDSVEADEIRMWSNPEFYVNPGGLRLDECSEDIQKAVHDLLRASLSPTGYRKLQGCCLINGFLGSLINGSKVMNEHSYNFRLFGQPDIVKPWAFTFFGHHLCIAVMVQGRRMVIGPSFMGAEPDYIDEGPHAGLRLFGTEEAVSLELMRSLSPAQRDLAVTHSSVLPDDLPPGRWAPHDERHVGGAGQDNRVVQYEGCPVSLFDASQKEDVVRLFTAFNEYYPSPVLKYRTQLFKSHLNEAYFAWIGNCDGDEPYYFRIHSPVAFMEFDFHAGVFLTNTEPAKCHIHTINRLPNGGDYGRALLNAYRRKDEHVRI